MSTTGEMISSLASVKMSEASKSSWPRTPNRCHECLLDTGVASSGPWIWLAPNLSMVGNQVFTDDDFLSRKPG